MSEKVEVELLRRLEAITVEREKEREELESLNRITEAALQRCDELRSLADSAAHKQGIAELRMMLAQKSRDEARTELAFIRAEYAAANESDLTRDALCLQLAALKHELRMATERAAIACRERDEAVFLNQAMNRPRLDKKEKEK